MMKEKLLLILALLAFSLVPLVQVVTSDTASDSESMFGPPGTPSEPESMFGPVNPDSTPDTGPGWFVGYREFIHPPLPMRPNMNYSAFYLIFKPGGTGGIPPSALPTPGVSPTVTTPTPTPTSSWILSGLLQFRIIPTTRPTPSWTTSTTRPTPSWTVPTTRPTLSWTTPTTRFTPSWTVPTTSPVPTEPPATYSPTPVGTPAREEGLVLTDLNLVGEYVKIHNNGQDRVDMTGWRLCDSAGHCINFIEWENGYRFVLLPYSTVTIYSNQTGTPSSTRLYWPEEMWNDHGDTARLYNANGVLVSTISR